MRRRRATEFSQNIEWQTPKTSQRFEIKAWGDDNLFIQRRVFTNDIKRNKMSLYKSSKAMEFDLFRKTSFISNQNIRSNNTSFLSNIDILKKQADMLDEDCMIRISATRTSKGVKSNQNKSRALYKKEINKIQIQKNRRKQIKSLYIDCLCSEKQAKTKSLQIYVGSQVERQKNFSNDDENHNFKIHHQKSTKTPFKKFFQRKRQQKIKKTIQNSFHQVSGRKLQNVLLQINRNVSYQ